MSQLWRHARLLAFVPFLASSLPLRQTVPSAFTCFPNQIPHFLHCPRQLTTGQSLWTSPSSRHRLGRRQLCQMTASDKEAPPLRSDFLRTLQSRGFISQGTDMEALDSLMETETISAYLGFDATADSLHVGSLLQVMILRHLQQTGHKPIILVGGGTTKVGDPSGKDTSRQMLTPELIQQNIQGISSVFSKFIRFGDGPSDAILVDNDEWLSSLKYLEFLRDYGTHFSVNRMLSFESVKLRLEREAPLSFLEFNYMILQAYDFLELNRRYGVRLQMGGSDQWGNIVNGVELGRRVDAVSLFGLTAPLITTSDGKKMGKSASGAVWLNVDKLPAYDYWQFWRNTNDDDVIRFLKLFTELSLDQITEMESWRGAQLNQAKVLLADEATRLLHGEACLGDIHQTVQKLFAGGGAGGPGSTASLPTIQVAKSEVEQGLPVLDLFIRLNMAKSKGEVRRLVKGNGVKLNDEKISDGDEPVALAAFTKGQLKVSVGKKKHGIVELV